MSSPVLMVALFRNLNLGHIGSPTKEQLVGAFGGNGVARSFQTNGTILFASEKPRAAVRQALLSLRESGYTHIAVVRPLAEIEWVVQVTPLPDPGEDVYRSMISFFDLKSLPTIELPLRSRDQLVELRSLDERSAASVCWKPRNTAGDVTGLLETLLQVPVTTRSLGTLQRLVAAAHRFGF
ncbi:DUF1697 domain-containing protein [Homoserinimonas sp. OAct 916]|uniref:DUF1697 domain-containing protein n=1 Tax=Homoserinimonas sp. OAct 916 TaxID=2211450 RepID=UPI000DBE079B|nr:DUF1697 domain-containing protein [Homoserinimonas sp. OAct 916]